MTFPRYPAYKESGVEWLGEVPGHWEVRQLGRIGSFSKGGGGTKEDEVEDGVPCVRYGDLYTQYRFFIERTKACVSPEKALAYTPIHYGDVLFAGSGETIEEIGKSAVNLLTEPACCGGDVILFRPSISVDAKFFGYAADCPQATFQKACMGRGFTVMHIYASELKYLSVALPPLAEQRAIAAFLDAETARIDALVAKQEALIATLGEKRRALISHAVTKGLDPAAPMRDSGVAWLGAVPTHWEVKPIKYLVRMESGGTPDKSNLNYWEGTIPWASAKDLKVELLRDTEDHVTQHALDSGAASLVAEESVIIVVRGMILLHTLPVTVNLVPLAINQDLKALHPIEGMSSRFLAWSLRGLADAFLARTDTAGHGTKALRTEDWSDIELGVPLLDEQRAITSYIDHETAQIDTLIAKAHELTAVLREHRAALVAAAVTGQIDVRGCRMGETL